MHIIQRCKMSNNMQEDSKNGFLALIYNTNYSI